MQGAETNFLVHDWTKWMRVFCLLGLNGRFKPNPEESKEKREEAVGIYLCVQLIYCARKNEEGEWKISLEYLIGEYAPLFPEEGIERNKFDAYVEDDGTLIWVELPFAEMEEELKRGYIQTGVLNPQIIDLVAVSLWNHISKRKKGEGRKTDQGDLNKEQRDLLHKFAKTHGLLESKKRPAEQNAEQNADLDKNCRSRSSCSS
jgi:hypothetical protein